MEAAQDLSCSSYKISTNSVEGKSWHRERSLVFFTKFPLSLFLVRQTNTKKQRRRIDDKGMSNQC